MMALRLTLKPIYVFSLCLALAFLLSSCARKKEESGFAPDFLLKTLEGQEIALSGLKGKVILLDFWATWCGPCKESVPHLIQMYKNYKDKGFELIGMSTDKAGDLEMVHRFVKSMDIPYPIILTPDEVARRYKITGLPTTILIDRKGKIREKVVGFNSAIGQQIISKVEELVAETP